MMLWELLDQAIPKAGPTDRLKPCKAVNYFALKLIESTKNQICIFSNARNPKTHAKFICLQYTLSIHFTKAKLNTAS